MTAGTAPGIVVGLDASEGSDAALDHALTGPFERVGSALRSD